MLHMFLVIVKVFGIILAVLLGILLLLILSVLFVPLHYRIEGQYRNQLEGKAVLRYLGPVFRMRILYKEEVRYKFYILGIPVRQGPSSKERDKTKKETAGADSEKNQEKEPEKEARKPDETTEAGTDKVAKASAEAGTGETPKASAGAGKSHKKGKKKKKHTSQDKRPSVRESAGNILQLFRNLKEAWEDERVRTGMHKLKEEIGRLLGKIKPRKFFWHVKFGFEDPASTGLLLAFLAILQGMWGHELHVEPDFENPVFETAFKGRGFIQGVRFVRLVWKYYFDKEIQYLIQKGNSLRRN